MLRLTSPWPDGAQGDLAIGDMDADGIDDVAFSTGGFVGVVPGPLDNAVDSDVVWWTRTWDDVQPGYPFGYSLLVADNNTLWVGFPGEISYREGARLWSGGLYVIRDPTQTP